MMTLTDSAANARPAAYRSRMRTRTAVAALAAIGAALLAAPVSAATTSPDVHVTQVERTCGNKVTVYAFRLENFGDHVRGVRGRVVWKGEGYSETFSRRVRTDWRTIQRERIPVGQRATLTLRAQGQVIMRAPMVGDCPTKADVV